MSGRGDRGGWRGGGRGRGRGRLAPGQRPVDERQRIDIAATLESFQASSETEYAFGTGLNNHERAIVHAECKKYGFTSKSFGKGDNRAVTVFKRRLREDANPIFELPLGDASLAILDAYFSKHPPTELELAQAAGGPEHDAPLSSAYGTAAPTDAHSSKNKSGKKDGKSHAAGFSPEEIAQRQQKWETSISRQTQEMRSLQEGREALPIAAYRDQIVSAVRENQVVLIAGETGCGKTTQVPQYLIEDSWSQNKGCRIVCTQPRRISAISVAERVAAERGESVGSNVGYSIRLDKKGGADASLMFCTNGVLLRMLTAPHEEGIARVTHLVVDEIHERDRFADFLLILVRDILPERPDLRVVLMSATLHMELFSSYFGGCPIVEVPGRTYPVQDFYLEDTLKLTGYQETAVKEIERELGRSAAGLIGGGSSGGERGAGQGLSEEERRVVETSIEAAFMNGSDEDFDALLEVTGAASADDAGAGSPAINLKHPVSGATALLAAAFRGRADIASVLLSNGADPRIAAANGMTVKDCALQCGHSDLLELLEDFENQQIAADELAGSALALSHYQSNTDVDDVDIQLIEALLQYICGEGKFKTAAAAAAPAGGDSEQEGGVADSKGACLIFLPGWDEIIRLKDQLENSPIFGSSRYLILPLHSMVAPAEQRRVFVRPPEGVRKIVLATNIAETAITIDDVVVVIDSGRLKEKSYDAYTGVSTLQSGWICKASERQRRGRAGRCQPGVAFHMYSRQRSDALAEFQLPEIKRSPLDEMGLQVKLLEKPERRVIIADFLAKAVEPPVPQAVTAAVKLLGDIGALDEDERLTSLGRHLASLPLPPALGKMLLYAVLYGCLDPVLTVACCMAYRDPWVLPAQMDARREASMLRARLATDAGGSSDHLATVLAYNGWKTAKARGDDRFYCSRNYLSPATMNMIDGMRTQLLSELTSRGFVTSLEEGSTQGHRADLVRAVLGCGFYPLIGRLLPLPARDQKARTSLLTRDGDKVRIHPASTNCKLRIEKQEVEDDEEPPAEFAALMFYDEITRGDAMLYVKSCTAMHPHPMVLVAAHVAPVPDGEGQGQDGGVARGVRGMQLGGRGEGGASEGQGVECIEEEERNIDATDGVPETGLLIIDGWLRFRVAFSAIAQLTCLRLRIASAFAHKVMHPRETMPPVLQGALDASSALFINESESGDGLETTLGSSYSAGGGGGGGYRARGGGGGRRHHLFRYSHHGPAPHRGGGRGYDGGGRYTTNDRGRYGGRYDSQGGGRGRSMPYPGGPYAPPGSNDAMYSNRGRGRGRGRGGGGGGRYGNDEYDDRHGVKRSHSGAPIYDGGEGRGGERWRGGGGRGRGGGGRGREQGSSWRK